MPVSMFEFSVPVFVRTLRNLRAVLEIGEKFAGEKGIAPDVLLQTRLIPDMLPLVRQVQIATDMAKNGSARLTAGFKKLMNVDPRPIPVKANTLIISNNFGFHARGAGVPGTHRAAFKLSMKETPFSRIGGEIADAAREKRVPAGA